MFGFVSGMGESLAEASNVGLAATDTNAIKAWMDQYCGKHPLDNVKYAAEVLVAELAKRK